MFERIRKIFALPKHRLGPLGILVGLQVVLSLGLSHYRPAVDQGYLVKNGLDYIVLWKEEGKVWQRSFAELNSALKFSKDGLGLESSPSVERASNLERVWIRDEFGAYVLLWKRDSSPYLHQWTFNLKADAEYFYDHFRQGAYTSSPYGHAMLLRAVEF